MSAPVLAAVVVPQAVEKLPLFHWHPASRALVVGDRDGCAFDAEPDPAAHRSYQRPLNAAMLRLAIERSGVDAVCLSFTETLARPEAIELVQELWSGPLLIATTGRGELSAIERLLPQVSAWVLLHAGMSLAPGAAAIIAAGRHVEVLWGLDEAPTKPPPGLERVAACHLIPRRNSAAPEALRAWEDAARAQIPPTRPVYDSRQRHSRCSCGATLLWRSGGRSRPDSLAADGSCQACGRPSGITMSGARPPPPLR